MVFIAAGAAAFPIMAPSTEYIVEARARYDRAIDPVALDQDSDAIGYYARAFNEARWSAAGLVTVGAALNAWSFWRAR